MAPKIRMKVSRPRVSQEATPSPSQSESMPAPSPVKRPREDEAASPGDESEPKKRKLVLKRRTQDEGAPAGGAGGNNNNNAFLPAPSPSYGFYREGGLSPGYGRSPAYGNNGANAGMSPYPYSGLSPAYARLNAEDLGGVLSVSVEHMLQELAPNGVIKGDIHVASPKETVGAILDKMAAYKVLALPVMDDKTGKFVDIVDTQDVVRVLVGGFTEREIMDSKHPKNDFVSSDVWHAMVKKGRAILKDHTVADMLADRVTGGDACVTKIDTSASVKELLAMFVKMRGQDGRPFHRVVLVTPEGNLRAMVSQSDIIRYLYKHQDIVKNVAPVTNTLAESRLTQRRVLVASGNVSVLYVLHKMCTYKAHMVAVQDDQKRLVQHFSASDLRGLTSDRFPILLLKVQGFGEVRKPMVLHANMSLWAALELFVAKKLHRASIVDDMNRPYAMVSISNLLSSFMKL